MSASAWRRPIVLTVGAVAVPAALAVRAQTASAAEAAPPSSSPVNSAQFQLVDILDHPSGLEQAAELLATQWPARGLSHRRQSLLSHCRSACLADRGAQIREVAAIQDPVPAIEINDRCRAAAQQIR